MNQTL